MKRILFAASAMMLLSLAAFAQEDANRDSLNNIVRGPYETNRFGDNWFVGIGGGVNLYTGDSRGYGSFGDKISPAVDVYFGKWITPAIGFRIGYSGINARGWSNAQTSFTGSEANADGMYREKFGMHYIHGDVMWNISDAFSGYKESRRWNFVPFVGTGLAIADAQGGRDLELAVSAGLLNIVRLTDALDLTVELRQMVVNPRFNHNTSSGSRFEGATSMTVGLAYNFGVNGFKRASKYTQADIDAYKAEIERLEAEKAVGEKSNEQLRKDNEALRNEVKDLRENPVTVTETVIPEQTFFFFNIDKAELDSKNAANLAQYAELINSTDCNYLLTGTADKATGTAAYNQKLSMRRAENVKKILVEKYGVDADRLIVNAEGDTNNRFGEPALNRTVIITRAE